MALIVSVFGGGCRAADPTAGPPLQQARVHNAAPLPAASSTFTSSDADLQPIEDALRTSLAFGGDPFVGLGWRFEGATEEFDPGGPSPVHTGRTRSLDDVPEPIGSLGDITAELNALASDPGLAALLGTFSVPEIPRPGYLDAVQMDADLSSTRVFWQPADPTRPNATLHFDFALSVQPDPADVFDLLLDIGRYRTPVNVDIEAVPCGTCAGIACTDPPGPTFAAYRSRLSESLGYARGDVNASYPDQRLDFVVTVSGERERRLRPRRRAQRLRLRSRRRWMQQQWLPATGAGGVRTRPGRRLRFHT